MPYCSNKPVPTPGHLLPRPKIPGPAASRKEEETSLKRKIFDSLPDAGDDNAVSLQGRLCPWDHLSLLSVAARRGHMT